jgi:hypothetical protein
MQYDYYYQVNQERLATLRQEAIYERLMQAARQETPGFYQHWTTWLDRATHVLKAGQRLSERKI